MNTKLMDFERLKSHPDLHIVTGSSNLQNYFPPYPLTSMKVNIEVTGNGCGIKKCAEQVTVLQHVSFHSLEYSTS